LRNKTNYDIFVVQKQTALERYSLRPTHVDFLEYAKRDNKNYQSLLKAHRIHTQCREHFLKLLDSLGLSYKLLNLDELHNTEYEFWSPENGHQINPNLSLVVSLGGDGTLLHASHFSGGQLQLIGINSCPEHSVGYLCALDEENMRTWFPKALDGSWLAQKIKRIQTKSSSGQLFPLALNDVFFCHQHPAATSRYDIVVKTKNSITQESHLSSGCWISTAAGSSAAIKGYGLPQFPATHDSMLFAVRELYNPHEAGHTLTKGVLTEEDTISIFSKMRQALACVDGPDNSGLLSFGDSIELSTNANCDLRLFVKPPVSG
jgi:NAD+ kinase